MFVHRKVPDVNFQQGREAFVCRFNSHPAPCFVNPQKTTATEVTEVARPSRILLGRLPTTQFYCLTLAHLLDGRNSLENYKLSSVRVLV